MESFGFELDRSAAMVLMAFFSCLVTLYVVPQTTRLFCRRHARRHRTAGAVHLFWLLVGTVDVAARAGSGEGVCGALLYDVILGISGISVTLTAAFDFQQHHDKVKNVASGTLDDDATVTFSEMIEHSFYQGLNLLQALHVHASGHFSSVTWSRLGPASLALITLPWLFRRCFPVNSFSDNYSSDKAFRWTNVMYRVKKWQYVFYKHALLHGINIALALSQPKAMSSSLTWRTYWLCLNTAYVMEFFLQTLVKRRVMGQRMMLALNAGLMIASSTSAIRVLFVHGHLLCTVASLVLQFVNRGKDFINVAIVAVLIHFI